MFRIVNIQKNHRIEAIFDKNYSPPPNPPNPPKPPSNNGGETDKQGFLNPKYISKIHSPINKKLYITKKSKALKLPFELIGSKLLGINKKIKGKVKIKIYKNKVLAKKLKQKKVTTNKAQTFLIKANKKAKVGKKTKISIYIGNKKLNFTIYIVKKKINIKKIKSIKYTKKVKAKTGVGTILIKLISPLKTTFGIPKFVATKIKVDKAGVFRPTKKSKYTITVKIGNKKKKVKGSVV